jgi:type I restriction enzyme, S subunit
MSFPRYERYKDSGHEWIGVIPTHWGTGRLKNVLAEMGSGGTPDTDDPTMWSDAEAGVAWVAIGDMSSFDTVLSTARAISPNAIAAKRLRVWPRGTLLFSMYASLGHVAELGIDAAINQAILALLPGDSHQPYLRSWLAFLQPRLVEQASRNTQDNLNAEKVRNLPIARPPLDEQAAIAAFLHHETAKIDALVEEQKRLIELLKEKRQAVISHAVTKGLNPNAPMKDSGVEWLGGVPAHWRVGGCGFHIAVLSGFAFPSSGFTQDESATRLLRGINVGVSRLKWDEVVYWQRVDGDGLEIYELKDGDLVIGMDRPLIADGVRIAKVTAADVPCLLLQRVASIQTRPSLNADYLHCLLSSGLFVAHFHPEVTGVSVPHISPAQIQRFVIPVPPVDEQEAVARFVQQTIERFDALTGQAFAAVELLQERRAALISAAVTGKIDVRSSERRPDLHPAC